MTTVDTRPGSLDLVVRPGNEVSLVMDWSASPLAGRTFTAQIAGVTAAPTVTIVSNTMTVTFSAAETTAAGALSPKVAWTLTETTSGSQVRVTGWLKLSSSGTSSQTSTTTLSVDSASVAVSVFGGGGLLQAATDLLYWPLATDLATQVELNAEAASRNAADATNAAAVTSEATARASADALLIPLSQKAAANGVATLGSDGLLLTSQLPTLAISEFLGSVASQVAMLALVGQRGDWCTRTDPIGGHAPTTWIVSAEPSSVLANWTQISTPSDVVLSVNGQVGVIVLGPGDVGADAAGAAAAEATSRANADTTLQTNITAEVTARAAAVTAEASARAAADALLASRAVVGYTLRTGSKAQTIPRNLAASTCSIVSGRLALYAIGLYAGDVISSISFFSGGTAMVSPTNQWFALYDSARNLLAVTADDTNTAWSTLSLKTLNLATPATYTVPTSGMYYVGIVVVAGTVPNLRGISTSAAPDIGGLAPILEGFADTGLTTPATAPSPATAITALAGFAWADVS